MKVAFLAAATLVATAAAVPSKNHAHQHLHMRDDVEVVTEVDVVNAIVAEEIVYVNTKGEPVSTSFSQVSATPTSTASETTSSDTPSTTATSTPTSTSSDTPTSTPTTSAVDKPDFVNHAASSSSTASTTEAPAPSTPSPSAAAPTTSQSSSSAPADSASGSDSDSGSSSGSSGYGLSYTPYGGNGKCKTQDQINSEFKHMSGFGMVRIYGTDCNQVAMVLKAARAKNMKVFAGIFNIDQVSKEAQIIIDAAAGNWDGINTVSVGNELVNNKQADVDTVVNAINTARTQLKQAGFNGNVVTVDTFMAIKENPKLCQASDFAAANCHAFFDGKVTADKAGDFVHQQAQEISDKCGGKRVFITESGWPWKGDNNGAAIPSPENQKAAISSLKSKFSDNIILFTAFDEMWKKAAADTFNAEQYWGMLKANP